MRRERNFGTLKWAMGLAVVVAAGIMVLAACSPAPAPAGGKPDAVSGADPAPAPETKPSEANPHADCPYEAMRTNLETGTTAAPAKSGPEASSGSLARIVFLTTSKSCPCTMNRCQKGEEAVNAALKSKPQAPALERLDYAADEEAAKKILEKDPAAMLPVLYLFGDQGELLAKLEGDFDEARVNETLDNYLDKRP